MRFTLNVGFFMLAMSPLANSSKAFCFGTITPSSTTCAPDSRFHTHATISLRFRTCRRKSLHVRGGGTSSVLKSIASAQDIPNNDSDESTKSIQSSKEEKFRRRGMSIALASTYLTVMGAKCALPSVLSLLTSRTQGLTFPAGTAAANGGAVMVTPQSRMAALLGLSTLAVALGKLLLGPVIDTLGGIRALQIALTLLSALLVTISCTQQFTLFAICWILVDFFFSSCWAGCINAIHQSFPERSWGKQIGILAVGARMGNTLSFALFATILYRLEKTVTQPWRHVFAVSALLQIVPIALLAYFGGKTLSASNNQQSDETENAFSSPTTPPSKPSFQASLRTLRREAATPEFWLHLISRSVLMVFASFLLFVPTLMSQVYGASNAVAAQGGSIYSLGCLLSVTFGSSWFSQSPKVKQALATVLFTGMATLSSLLQLAHVTGIWTQSVTSGLASMFLWGFAFSIPFYIPPSLYALSRGGKQSSATIADVFDIGGFLLLAMFNGYVASINHATPAAWIPTFCLTTACAVISLLSLPFAILQQ